MSNFSLIHELMAACYFGYGAVCILFEHATSEEERRRLLHLSHYVHLLLGITCFAVGFT